MPNAAVRTALSRAEARDCCRWAEFAGFLQLRGELHGSQARDPAVDRTRLVGSVRLPHPQAVERFCESAARLGAIPSDQLAVVAPDPRTREDAWTVELELTEQTARRAGVITRHRRRLLGLPTHILHGRDCDAIACWRAALLAAGEVGSPTSRRPLLAVTCPNTVVAVALVGLARRLGANARVRTDTHDIDHTVITNPEEILAVLTATGGPAAAAAWLRDGGGRDQPDGEREGNG